MPESTPSATVALWRYVVPNAVTSASLLVGLFVMVAAIEGRFVDAGWLIVLCVLLDKLDGTFARLLGASSKFGTELDSLADLVVFGVAPAVTLFRFADAHTELYAVWAGWEWLLQGSLGLFVVCSALRLAKFNVLAEAPKGRPSVFYGIPTTLSGGLLGLFLLIGMSHELEGLLQALPLIALGFGLLMVSNLPMPKIGKRGTRAGTYLQAVNLSLAYICGFARVFPEYLAGMTLAYAFAGLVWGQLHRNELRGPGETADGGLEPQAS